MQIRMCVQLDTASIGNSKIEKKTFLITNGSLMKVESIAEAPLGVFCNTFDLQSSDNRSWKHYLVILSVLPIKSRFFEEKCK